MKTLYININNEEVQSNGELEVLNHDLDSDFFFYLGEKIAKGCKVENENALITDFNTSDTAEDYQKIIAQWHELKTILFSEELEGEFKITLPNGYIHWLKFHPQYVSVYDRNFSHGEPTIITIDLEELYEDSVEYLQRKILHKLQRDELYLEIDEIVFNDDAVTRKSPIVRTIKEKYEGIGFKAYKKWLQDNEDKPHTTPQVCRKCGKNPCECNAKTCDFFPLENIVLHKTSCSSILQEHLEYDSKLIYYKPKPGLIFIQDKRDSFFSMVSISEEEAYPKLWRNLLGLKWGESYNACISIVKIKGYKHRAYDLDGAWTNRLLVLSIDEKYIFELSFLHDKLNLIRAILNRCPHCKSNNLMLLDHFNYNEIKMKCMNCGLLLIDGLGIECPECRADNIKDDGSNYRQYTCNDCGHNWGHDDTVECPECGSDDVENDGTDNMQYECNVCGHNWGENEVYDNDNEEDYYDDTDNSGNIMSTYLETLNIIPGITTKHDIIRQGGVFVKSKYGANADYYEMPNGVCVQIHNDIVCVIRFHENSWHCIPLFYKNLGLYWGIDKIRFRNIFEGLGFSVYDDDCTTISASRYCEKYNKSVRIEITHIGGDMVTFSIS